MAVEFTCPACEGVLRASDGPAGRLIRCGGCLALLRVPNINPIGPAAANDEPIDSTPPELLPVAYPLGHSAPQSVSPPASVPQFVPPLRPAQSSSPLLDSETEESPPARSATFWLAISLIGITLGLCVCCGLVATLVPEPDWQTFESPQGGYSVDLPAEPRDDMANRIRLTQRREFQEAVVEGTTLWTRAENFSVAYWDIPSTRQRARVKTDEQLLDDVIRWATNDPEVRVVLRRESMEVSGFPAKEFEYQTRKQGTITGRVVIADSRAYLLIAGGRFARPESELVRQFLDSFAITDPKLLDVAKQRADNIQGKGRAKD